MRSKRIGTTTAGVAIIAVGIVFMISIFIQNYDFLFSALRFWPVILVMLGAEILLATYIKSETEKKMDVVAIIIMMLCVLFAFCCEGARIGIEIASGI
jgi:hypothetical protein